MTGAAVEPVHRVAVWSTVVSISGDPDIECTMTVGDPGAATAGAMVATAMRIVNAVPYVVAAPPGLVSSTDLPLTLPFRPIPSTGG